MYYIHIHTYVHTYMHAYMHTDWQSVSKSVSQSDRHPDMHACMHAYIHIYTYMYIQEFLSISPVTDTMLDLQVVRCIIPPALNWNINKWVLWRRGQRRCSVKVCASFAWVFKGPKPFTPEVEPQQGAIMLGSSPTAVLTGTRDAWWRHGGVSFQAHGRSA